MIIVLENLTVDQLKALTDQLAEPTNRFESPSSTKPEYFVMIGALEKMFSNATPFPRFRVTLHVKEFYESADSQRFVRAMKTPLACLIRPLQSIGLFPAE